MRSPMLRALMSASEHVPEQLQQFDAIARSGTALPSSEEYSVRVGEELSPWRKTCYFDVGRDSRLIDVANDRFEQIATALRFPVPPAFFEVVRSGAVSGADVMQLALGIDASGERARLKYYVIFQGPSGVTVERLRAALDVPALPATLIPDSVNLLGIDFGLQRPVVDFKIYVRLDSARVPQVVRNLAQLDALWRGSRYLVFKQSVLREGREIHIHASSSTVLDDWLTARAERDDRAAEFRRQLTAMNEQLQRDGEPRLQPWIVGFPYERGRLLPGPWNMYLHFEGGGG